MLPIKTILCPTDFSGASGHALRMAFGLARDYGARLILLNAVEPPVYYGELGVNFSAPENDRESVRERVAALSASEPGLTVEPLVVEGIAPAEILRVARERQCDLVVLGSHGRSGLGRVLMGSVAEEVARKAPCPVLIVRTPHEAAPPAQPETHAAAP